MKAIQVITAAIVLLIGCNAPQEQTLSVSGHGEIEVVPDMVNLNVRSSFLRSSAKQSYTATSETLDSLSKICKRMGISEKDIKTSHISVKKHFKWIKNSQVFAGYYSSAFLNVTLRDLSRFGELSETILETKGNEIEGITYDHSRYDSLLNEAGVIAVRNAQFTANKLAEEAGVKVAKIESLSNESPKSMPGEIGYEFGRIRGLKAGGARGESIEPGVIKITNNAYITYIIE